MLFLVSFLFWIFPQTQLDQNSLIFGKILEK